jgi:hypothetical protein
MNKAPATANSPESKALLDELIAAHQQLVDAIRAGHDAEADMAEERANEILRRLRAIRVS